MSTAPITLANSYSRLAMMARGETWPADEADREVVSRSIRLILDRLNELELDERKVEKYVHSEGVAVKACIAAEAKALSLSQELDSLKADVTRVLRDGLGHATAVGIETGHRICENAKIEKCRHCPHPPHDGTCGVMRCGCGGLYGDLTGQPALIPSVIYGSRPIPKGYKVCTDCKGEGVAGNNGSACNCAKYGKHVGFEIDPTQTAERAAWPDEVDGVRIIVVMVRDREAHGTPRVVIRDIIQQALKNYGYVNVEIEDRSLAPDADASKSETP